MANAVLVDQPIPEPAVDPQVSKSLFSNPLFSNSTLSKSPDLDPPTPTLVVIPDEKPPVFEFDPPAHFPEEERKRMETEAREYERRCWVETGAPPKWDLLIRADPKFAAAVRAEADRIYRQAMAELNAYWARQAQLLREIAEEARREARRRQLTGVLECVGRFLARQGDDATLGRLARSFKLANRIATIFRWPVIWNRETVRNSLRPRVLNLRPGPKGQIATSQEEILRALDELIDIICNPEISAEDTRRALDDFLKTHTKGWPPPKDLVTKAIEFTSAKSLWLKRYRLFYPGPESTSHGQKIPDFVSPLGPGDNVRASGFNRPIGNGAFEPVLNPNKLDPKDMKSMEGAYNSVMNDLRAKISKYKDKGKVVVTVDATSAPWMDPQEIRARIIKEDIGQYLGAVYLLKGGYVQKVWP